MSLATLAQMADRAPRTNVAREIDPELDRDRWLEWRRDGIGASEMPAVLGLSPWHTALDVYYSKLGVGESNAESEVQAIGHALEPALAALYERRTGRKVADLQIPMWCEAHPYLLATLDGLTTDGRVVEFKTCGSMRAQSIGEEGTDDLPAEWIVQAHQQMLVADADACDFCVLMGGFALSIGVYTVHRNPEWDAAIIERGGEFWDRVLAQDPPPPSLPADLRNLPRFYPPVGGEVEVGDVLAVEVARWEALGQQGKALDGERRQIEGLIREAMGGATVGLLPDGRRIKRQIQEVPERTQVVKAYTKDFLQIVKGANR